ncbi:MAG: ribosome-associated translation inhibitor RaiA [Flavobacteriales bacterium]|nr:ribosome-associated translation inhibitor RaiA [Flavobacteriales bacterium]
MNIKIQSIHFDADKKLLAFIQQKISKLELYNDKIIDVNVYLKLNNHHNKENKHVEVKINLANHSMFKDAEARTFEAATDIVVEALKIQIKKRKELLLQKS